MDLDAIIKAVQSAVKTDVDGKAGPATWTAIYYAVTGKTWPGETVFTDGSKTITLPVSQDLVDDRSEKALATLLPQVRPFARALIHSAVKQGIQLVVTSAMRTYDEQNDLYAQGRTKPGKIVTNARGGYSNHNFGIAFDVTIFRDGQPVWESPAYKAVGAIGKNLGLTWGGDWTSIDDEPHFELRPSWAATLSESEMLSQLRTRKEAGKTAFA